MMSKLDKFEQAIEDNIESWTTVSKNKRASIENIIQKYRIAQSTEQFTLKVCHQTDRHAAAESVQVTIVEKTEPFD